MTRSTTPHNFASSSAAQASFNKLRDIPDRLRIVDTSSGVEQFATPASFSGDQSDLIGGTLRFDVELINTGDNLEVIPISIRGNNGDQINTTIDVPDTTGNYSGTLELDLSAASLGVSEAYLAGIMSDLQHFTFTSDSQFGNETWFLDNVSFETGFVDGENTSENMGVGYDDALGPVDNGNDLITEGSDIIFGNAGDDTISAGGGADSIHGDNSDPQNLIINGAFDDPNEANPSNWTVNEPAGGVQVQVLTVAWCSMARRPR